MPSDRNYWRWPVAAFTAALVVGLLAKLVETSGTPTAVRHEGLISIGPNVHVSKSRAKLLHGEVILAADPGNSARLLAGAMADEGPPDLPSVFGYFSSDGGKTWTLTLEKKAMKGRTTAYYDPATAFSPDGAAHFAAIRRTSQKTQVELVSSSDGGKTWGTPITMSEDQADRPFIAVDCTRGKFRGYIYCNCTMPSFGPRPKEHGPAIYTSRDGGKTFNPPKRLVANNPESGPTPGPSAVLADGKLLVPYSLRFPGGLSFRLRQSNDGGESFLDEQSLLVRDYLGYNLNTVPVPVLAVDPGSKAFADRLYLTWAEKTPAGLQIMLTFSKDRGVTWSKPVSLSEQPAPEKGVAGKSYHALRPSVAVNDSGVIGVTWYDTRDGKDGKPASNVRFRASLDGGFSWLPSVRVTDVASTFELDDKEGGVKNENWLGETAGLAADAAGVFHALWIDNRTGVKQMFTAPVVVRPDREKEH